MNTAEILSGVTTQSASAFPSMEEFMAAILVMSIVMYVLRKQIRAFFR